MTTFVPGQQIVPASPQGTFGPSSLATARGVDTLRAQRLAAAGSAPIGFNSYDLLYRYLLSSTYGFQACIDFMRSCGADLARVMFPCFSSAEYTTLVFANGIPAGEFTREDFRPEFLARTQEVFDAAAASGLGLLVSLSWNPLAVPELFGETVLTGTRLESSTHRFNLRMARWFAQAFGNHPAVRAFAFFNEPVYDPAGVTAPTPANLGAVTSALINEVRRFAPHLVATTTLVPLPLDSAAGRPDFESEADHLATIAASADALGINVYGYGPSQAGMSFVGSFGSTTAAYGPSTSNNLGFEGFEGYLSSIRAVAERLGAALWITETGVPIDVDAASASLRRQRLLDAVVGYANKALIWNVGNVDPPQPNQGVWQIRPGQPLATTSPGRMSSVSPSTARVLP